MIQCTHQLNRDNAANKALTVERLSYFRDFSEEADEHVHYSFSHS